MSRQSSNVPVSVKGGLWRGTKTRTLGTSPATIGFIDLRNCYVSSDGQEIRRFPGWKTSIDPVTAEFTDGYRRLVIDARVVPTKTGTSAQRFEKVVGDFTGDDLDTQFVLSHTIYYHNIHVVRGKVMIVGESDFRKEPVRNGSGTNVVVLSWATVAGPPGAAILTLDIAPRFDAAKPHHFNALRVGDDIYLDNLTDVSAGNAELNNLLHTVIAVSGVTVTLATVVTTVSTSSTLTGRLYRTKDKLITGGTVGKDYYDAAQTAVIPLDYGLDDPECLTVYTSESLPNVNSPVSSVQPAYLATRMRDFHDDPTNATSAQGLVEGVGGYSRRRQRFLPYRTVPASAGDRLLLAAPGYGCIIQCPAISTPVDTYATQGALGIEQQYNDIYDRPRCLGVPKGVLLDPFVPSIAVYGLRRPGVGAWVAGTFQIKVGWRDDVTGEVSLASETLTVTTVNTDAVFLYVLFPGYYMSETLALTCQVYITEAGGEVFGLWLNLGAESALEGATWKYGLPPTAASPETMYLQLNLPVPLVADTDFNTPPPIIQQMPMGASAVSVQRGVALFGGQIGTHGAAKELKFGTCTPVYNGSAGKNLNYPFIDQLTMRLEVNVGNNGDNFGLAATGIVPPAYAGTDILLPDALKYPRKTLTLRSMVNSKAFDNTTEYQQPFRHYIKWQIEPFAYDEAFDVLGQEASRAYMKLPRNRYQFSEPGFVSFTPFGAAAFLDAEENEDITTIGRFRNITIFCTKTQTHGLQWVRSPAGNATALISSEFGCIAPNSMVEYDGGTAWISERGPVALGAGISHVGADLERRFLGDGAIYRSDSFGMMRHAFSAHDNERGLVYFGLISGPLNLPLIPYKDTSLNFDTARSVIVAWGASSQDVDTRVAGMQSRMPCNEFLVWSYRTGVWSTWIPPLAVFDMMRSPDSDGAMRMHCLASDGRIYSMDDLFAEKNRVPHITATSAAVTAGTTLIVTGAFNGADARGANDDFVEVGTRVQIYDITTNVLKHDTTVATVSSTTQVILTAAGTWVAGDGVMFGARPDMIIETQHFNLGGKDPTGMDTVDLRYSLQDEGAGVPGWVLCEVFDEEGDIQRYTEKDTTTNTLPLGLADVAGRSRQVQCPRGRTVSREHKVRVTISGDGQLRLQDLFIHASAE